MAKKIIITVIVLVTAGLGIYFGISKFGSYNLKADIGSIKTPEITMPFESGLEELELSSFDMGATLPSNLFTDILIDIDLSGEEVELQSPGISVGTPSIQTGTPPAGWQPDEATCTQFQSAPSCMFVPEQYRDLCQQCKDLGY